MGKWINITGKPGEAWYLDDEISLELLEGLSVTNHATSLPLRNGGTIVVHGSRVSAYLYGEDDDVSSGAPRAN